MLCHSLGGAVIFNSLQPFIAPALDLMTCLPYRQRREAINFTSSAWILLKNLLWPYSIKWIQGGNKVYKFCLKTYKSCLKVIFFFYWGNMFFMAKFNKMESKREVKFTSSVSKLTISVCNWYFYFCREILSFLEIFRSKDFF